MIMSTYYEITRYKEVVVQQEDYISIPATDEKFIRSIPADVWQAAQKGDRDALATVWDLAIAAGYEDEYVERFHIDDTDVPNAYEYAEWSN